MAEEYEKGKEESRPLQDAYLARVVLREDFSIHCKKHFKTQMLTLVDKAGTEPFH